MAAGSRGTRSSLFKKNEDNLPFFSFHPATKVGKVIRIALLVFMLIVLILNLLSRAGLVFVKYYDLSYLIYLIPLALLLALCVLGLFKRMNTPILKIIVCGALGFMGVSIIMTIGSMLSITSGYAFSPAMGIKLDNGETVVMMRSCIYPEDAPKVTVNEGTDKEYTAEEYTYRIDAYKYTAAPSDGKGKSEGAIWVDTSSKYSVEAEWTSAGTCRYYLASDSSGTGYGEILVTFDGESESTPEEGSVYRSASNSADGTRTAFLYRSDSYIEQKTTSLYMLSEECFERVYTAFPSTMYYFIKSNVRSEGQITVKPFGSLNSLNVDKAQLENGIVVITPGDSCEGASGEITLYLNEKASPAE